jgi:hypothetical protein
MSGRRVVVGLVTVASGAALFIERIGGSAAVASFLERWWPLVIVVIGVGNLIRYAENYWALVGPMIAISIAAFITLFTTGLVRHAIYPLAWPAAVTLAGASLLLLGADWEVAQLPHRNEIRQFVCLGAARLSSYAPAFRRADVTVILGSYRLDLRSAGIHAKAVVNVNALFGTVDVILPAGVTVWERRPFVLSGKGLDVGITPQGEGMVTISVLGFFGNARTRQPVRQQFPKGLGEGAPETASAAKEPPSRWRRALRGGRSRGSRPG